MSHTNPCPRERVNSNTPFRHVLEAVATGYLADLDPELDTAVKTNHVLASIRKRFADEEGDYQTYLWGAFSRGRKQEDVQLYVRIDWNIFRFGLSFGSAAEHQVAALRAAADSDPVAIWTLLAPLASGLEFFADEGDRSQSISLDGPDAVKAWLAGANPAALRELAPDDPVVTSPTLVDEVGRLLAGLHPIAALAWGDASGLEGSGGGGDLPEDAYTLAELAADTYLPIEDLEEWAAMLRGGKRQAILYGPPGTGKTFIARSLARFLAGVSGEVQLVQFHPSFSYEDFLEGLRPADDLENFRYEVRPGIFYEFCEAARRRLNDTFVFIIDEINRADLGSVLGELMVLLEYRGDKIQLPYSQRHFSVPKNVVLIATMNTADRSLALVDFALRRRFHTIEIAPNKSVLEGFVHQEGVADDPELVLEMFTRLQAAVGNASVAPGHSYLMAEDLSADGLRRIWRYELRPYLAEYWFEHATRLDQLDEQIAELLGEGT